MPCQRKLSNTVNTCTCPPWWPHACLAQGTELAPLCRALSSHIMTSVFQPGKSFVSQSGLEAVLKNIRENGLPESSSRRTIKRARDVSMDAGAPVGGLWAEVSLKLTNGSYKSFPMINPIAMLWTACNECPGFASLMAHQLKTRPSTPENGWRIVLYADEIVPGNNLAVHNGRKLWAVYWSMFEWGPYLSAECLWMNIITVRSSFIKQVEGGLSQLFKAVAASFFKNPFDLSKGVLLSCGGPQAPPQLFFATITAIVADEAALKQAWSVKGSSGTLPCICCRNVVSLASGLHLNDATNTLVPISETDPRSFCLATDNSVVQAAGLLSRSKGASTKSAFERLEQSLGLTYSEHGILFDPQALQHIQHGPISATMYDWMHCYFVSGVWNHECGWLMGALASIPISNQTADQYMKGFTWPRRLHSRKITGMRIFEKRPGNFAGEVKASASEGLASYAVIRQMLQELAPTPTDESAAAIQSYYALCRVLDHLHAIMKGRGPSPPELEQAIRTHLCLMKVAYGEESFFPKCHYCFHLPSILRRHGTLVSCWTHERKHREPKRYASKAHNANLKTTAFERGLLTDITLAQFADLREFKASNVGLVNGKLASDTIRDLMAPALELESGCNIFASEEAMFRTGETCRRQDVVVTDGGGATLIGEVWFHILSGNKLFTCMSPWAPLGANRFRVQDDPLLVPTNQICKVCVFKKKDDVATVVP